MIYGTKVHFATVIRRIALFALASSLASASVACINSGVASAYIAEDCGLTGLDPQVVEGWVTTTSDGGKVGMSALVYACDLVTSGQMTMVSQSDPGKRYVMALDEIWERNNDTGTKRVFYGYFSVDLPANAPAGKYIFESSGFLDAVGRQSKTTTVPSSRTMGNPLTYELKDLRPPTDKPTILVEDLRLVYSKGTGASVHYMASVRCSLKCGRLPSSISARLCRVGASYVAPPPVCTSAIRLHARIERPTKVLVGGSVAYENTFWGTFNLGLKPDWKDYAAQLNVITGSKPAHQPVRGKSLVNWSIPMVAPVSTTTTVPSSGSSLATSTTAGTSTQSSSNSVYPMGSVISEAIGSGADFLTVKGAYATVPYSVDVRCGPTCSKLSTVTVRLCKVGTSYTDSSCMSAVRLSWISDSTTFGKWLEYGPNQTFGGTLKMSATPTGAKYRAYFRMDIVGISGYRYFTSDSEAVITWVK